MDPEAAALRTTSYSDAMNKTGTGKAVLLLLAPCVRRRRVVVSRSANVALWRRRHNTHTPPSRLLQCHVAIRLMTDKD